MQIISNPPDTFLNSERHFQTGLFCCSVTKQWDKCIRVKLGEVAREDGKIAEIHGNFSEEGLKALMADLQAAPPPVEVPSPQEVREGTTYQWGVVMEDDTHLQQYPVEGGETPFRVVHLPSVKEFWIIPRFDPAGLPWYGLIKGVGFVRSNQYQHAPPQLLTRYGVGGVEQPLPIPDEPYEWQYYRQVALTFGQYSGGQDSSTHLMQVLGWKIGERLFTIGIEEDGSFQIIDDETSASG